MDDILEAEEFNRLAAQVRSAVTRSPEFAADWLLLFAEAADELAEEMRLSGRFRPAESVAVVASELRALAPIMAAP